MLLFDVGNSRIKAALVDDRHPTEFRRWTLSAYGKNQLDDLESEVASRIAGPSEHSAAIASVHPATCLELTKLLARHGVQSRVWQSDGAVFATGILRSDLESPATTGVDRLLSAIGALARAPVCDVVVVDCGSALTVNYTTADRTFRGGAIMPGLRTMTSALHANTAALPDIVPTRPPAMPAKNTADAISVGAFAAVLGGVERLLAELDRAATGPVQRFLTGGAAPLLAEHLPPDFELAPNLVLEGLAELCAQTTKHAAAWGPTSQS